MIYMKKSNILNIILIGVLFISAGFAAMRGNVFVERFYKNNGDTRVPFAISISSTSWTLVLPKDEHRRYTIIQTSTTAPAGVICLSTTNALATVCSDTTKGIRITGSNNRYEDYSEAVLYGRLQDSVAGSVSLYGEYQYDSRDTAVTP